MALVWALAAAVVAVGVAGGAARAAGPRYTVKPGVRLSPEVREKLADIAERYHKATKRTFLVTSGTRSPREQAEAMYGKLRAGDRLWVYRDQASVGPIREAYDRGRKKRWKKARVIDAMTEIIAGQVARGVYISRHLRAHAFDVRCYDMTRRQKRAFRAAVEAARHVRVIEEKRPPHFHCEVRIPRKTAAPGDEGAEAEDEDTPVADDGPVPEADTGADASDAGAAVEPDGGAASKASDEDAGGAPRDETDAGARAD